MWIESRWGETTTIAGLLVAVSVLNFVVLPTQVDSGFGAGLSPRFVLDIVVYGIAAVCLLRVATLWLRPAPEVQGEEVHAADRETRHYGRVAVIFAGCLLYAYVLIDLLGFYLSSILVLLGFALLMGERRLLLLVLYPLGMAAALYMLFDVGFGMRMPAGELIRYLQLR